MCVCGGGGGEGFSGSVIIMPLKPVDQACSDGRHLCACVFCSTCCDLYEYIF